MASAAHLLPYSESQKKAKAVRIKALHKVKDQTPQQTKDWLWRFSDGSFEGSNRGKMASDQWCYYCGCSGFSHSDGSLETSTRHLRLGSKVLCKRWDQTWRKLRAMWDFYADGFSFQPRLLIVIFLFSFFNFMQSERSLHLNTTLSMIVLTKCLHRSIQIKLQKATVDMS